MEKERERERERETRKLYYLLHAYDVSRERKGDDANHCDKIGIPSRHLYS